MKSSMCKQSLSSDKLLWANVTPVFWNVFMCLFVVLIRALLLIPFLANFAFERKQVVASDSVALKGVECGKQTFTVIDIALVCCLFMLISCSSAVLTHSGMLMKTLSRRKDFFTIIAWEGSLMVF